jgi:hypothetical protein
MKLSDYRKALVYARRNKLCGVLHRFAVFFPDIVQKCIERGHDTGLPKALLTLPLFSENKPVYHVKLLGDLVVTKDQRYTGARLSPQEKAFIIHCALRAGTPGDRILVSNINENFWQQSKHPSHLLSHTLVRIKRKLKIPRHVLTISSARTQAQLVNRGVYLTTDYGELKTLLVQIQSLERAGEWHYALRDYLRALKLVRGAPFEKMYDPWSEQMRGVILNKIEQAAIQCIKMCVEQGYTTEIKKTIAKISQILPHSEELHTLIRSL